MVAPKLRFDGFNSDWTLDSIGAVISNKSKKYDPEKSEMDFPCIELEHLSQQTGEILGTISAKDQKSIKNVFDENSVLFGKLRPYLRKFAKPNFQGVCSSEIWVLTSKKMQPNFLFQYVQTDGFSELTQIQAGSKMPRADWGSISNGEILFPIFEEQTKIASFLSAVDEKISQLTKKHQLLSQYKQGMMQKLFSQQIRFKADDGSEFGAWESKKLNEIGQSFNGLVGKSKEDFGEGEAYITYKQIFDHRKINLNNVNFVNIQPNDTQNMVKKGDLFFTTSSETADEVAYCSAILDDFEFPLYLNSFCFGYRPNSANILNSVYASFYFRSEIFRNKINHLAQGSTRFNISKTAFMNVVIHLPMLEEQTKIANFLSAIDQKIDVVSEQLEQAKLWKKGLLQQMFV